MKKLSILFIAALVVLSCSNNKFRAKIEGEITGLKSGEITLKVLELNNQRTLDTIKVESGRFSYTIKKSSDNSDFYYLYYKTKRVASLFVMSGDKIIVNKRRAKELRCLFAFSRLANAND